MNKLLTLAIVAGMAPLGFAADGNTASATAQASVTILAPVTVTSSGSMQFGKVVVSGLPTTIKIDDAGTVKTDNNATVYVHQGSTAIPHFSITKDTTAFLAISITPAFSLGTFVVDADVITGANTFATSGSASYMNKPLCGALTFPAGTMPNGMVTGTITIKADYI